MNRFYVGQKVVCVDASCADARFPPEMSGLQEGAVYSIRWIARPPKEFVARFPDMFDEIWIGLDEIVRPRVPGTGIENGFAAYRFEPLVGKPEGDKTTADRRLPLEA